MTISTKTFSQILHSAAFFDIAVFTVVATIAIGAGYTSLSNPPSDHVGDITGSTRPVKAAPLTTPQPMPAPIDAPQN